MRPIHWVGLAGLLLAGAGYWWREHPRGRTAEGPVDANGEPVQEATEDPPFTHRTEGVDVLITPRARYDLSGELVSHRRNLDDLSYEIPIDACVVWGDMLREPFKSALSYANHGRVCYFQWKGQVNEGYVLMHLSNNHLIPANDNVRRAIFSLSDGDAVRIRGYLADATFPPPEPGRGAELLSQLSQGALGNVSQENGAIVWRTSMTRADQGMGACETIYVESLQIGGTLYQ